MYVYKLSAICLVCSVHYANSLYMQQCSYLRDSLAALQWVAIF